MNVGNHHNQWLVFLRRNASNNFTTVVVRRQDITEESFLTLLRNGDVALLHPLLAYICDGMQDTARVFRSVAPHFEEYIRRALRECVFDYGPFGLQRIRFSIFEYFTRFATRQLVAEALATSPNWHYYVSVNNLEHDIWGEWYEWFEQTGIFVGVSFLAETKQHYRKLRELVQQWKQNNP